MNYNETGTVSAIVYASNSEQNEMLLHKLKSGHVDVVFIAYVTSVLYF